MRHIILTGHAEQQKRDSLEWAGFLRFVIRILGVVIEMDGAPNNNGSGRDDEAVAFDMLLLVVGMISAFGTGVLP